MKRKVVSLLLIATIAVSMAACGGGSSSSSATSEKEETSAASSATSTASKTESTAEADTSSLKIGVVAKYQHEFYMTMFDGAKDAAKELGISEIECTNPSSPTDAMSQVQMVEDMVTKDVDVLVVVPNQPDTLAAALAKAHDKGITIVAADTDFDYEYKVAYAGTGNEAAGSTVAETLIENLDDDPNVVIMRGPLGGVSFDQRVAGATKTLEENNVNILEVVDAESEADVAASKTEDLIQKYGDDLDAIICLDDNMTPGAVTAIKQANKTGQILVTGFDAGQAVLEMIKSGEVLLDVAQNPYNMGYEAVMAGVASHNGEDVESNIDTGVTLITAENVDEHLE